MSVNRIIPLFGPVGILDRAHGLLMSSPCHSGQVAVLLALVACQAAAADGYDPSTPPDERKVPSVTESDLAAYTRLSRGTVREHLKYWVERGNRNAVRRDLTSPFRAYYIGA